MENVIYTTPSIVAAFVFMSVGLCVVTWFITQLYYKVIIDRIQHDHAEERGILQKIAGEALQSHKRTYPNFAKAISANIPVMVGEIEGAKKEKTGLQPTQFGATAVEFVTSTARYKIGITETERIQVTKTDHTGAAIRFEQITPSDNRIKIQ